MKSASIALLMICLAGLASAAVEKALAQTPQTRQPQPGRQAPPPRDPKEYQNEQMLRDFPRLPDLPEYSGQKKFMGGFVIPNLHGGPSYTIRFDAKETPQVVMDWYKSYLGSSGWTIDRITTGELSSHTEKANMCNVSVHPSGVAGYRTNVTIIYREAKMN